MVSPTVKKAVLLFTTSLKVCTWINLSKIPSAAQEHLWLYQFCNHMRAKNKQHNCRLQKCLSCWRQIFRRIMQLFHHQCPELCCEQCLMGALLDVTFWLRFDEGLSVVLLSPRACPLELMEYSEF